MYTYFTFRDIENECLTFKYIIRLKIMLLFKNGFIISDNV